MDKGVIMRELKYQSQLIQRGDSCVYIKFTHEFIIEGIFLHPEMYTYAGCSIASIQYCSSKMVKLRLGNFIAQGESDECKM